MSKSQLKQEGKIKFYNEAKGYGFITDSASGNEIFFHRTKVVGELTRKDQDKIATYEITDGKKGPEAVNIQVK